MKIKINNEIREVADGMTLTELLSDTPQGGTATAVNGCFVAREAREATILKDGDAVMIIRAAYGG